MKRLFKRYDLAAIAFLLAFLSSAQMGSVPVRAESVMPELPREYLDTGYSLPKGGNRIVVSAGGDLQAALDQAQPGDVVELEAGATFTGNFKLREKSGEGWIYVQTSAYDSLPAPGTRVSPEHSPLMPKIVTPNENPALMAVGSAHHFRFVGIEFGVEFSTRDNPNNGNTVWSIVQLHVDNPTGVSELASDIYFDRVYIHGNPEANVRRGILANSRRTAVVDSYISDIHVFRFGTAPNGQDSQAFGGFNGPGPFKLVNNYLEASTENVMFGGAATSGPEFVPSDIEFRRNYLFKPPSWRLENSGLGYDYWVKNIFELKNAQRVLIDSNVMENSWKGADQDGFAVLFTVRAEGSNPWNTVSDVTFTNNIIRHASNAIQFLGTDVTESEGLNRILIRNNLFDDINGKYNGSGWKDGWGFQITSDNVGVTMDHNTILQTDLAFFLSGTTSPGFTFTNNIIQSIAKWNYITFSGAGEAVRGKAAFDAFLPGHYVANNMVVGNPYLDPAYPAGYFIDTTIDQAGFENYNGGDGGDYRLTASSPGKNKGTDGKDVGADIDLLEAATLGVIDGAIDVQDIVDLCGLFIAKNGASKGGLNGFENAAAHIQNKKALFEALDNQINALENKNMLTKEQADVLHSLLRQH